MADDDLELDTDGGAKGGSKKGGKGGMKMIIIIVVVALVAAGAGVGVTMFLVGGDSTTAESADASAEQKSADEKRAEANQPKSARKPAFYYGLEPPFVVNFGGENSQRFLQANVEVMTREATVLDDVKLHMPVLRNNLLLLFSSQDPAVLGTLEGKEGLRKKTLAEIKKVLKKETGRTGVEAVYFTSFVMQ